MAATATMERKNTETRHVPGQAILRNVRLSYVNLVSPKSFEGGESKYSAMIIVPKDNIRNKAAIDSAIQEAEQRGIKKHGAAFPKNPKTSVHDGDGAKAGGGEYGPECAGSWVFNASSKADRKPILVDGNLNPILDPMEIYSGMYADVSVNFFAYCMGPNKGIGAQIDKVRKVADGEPLGFIRTSAEEDFGSVDDLI